jgi:hypothetical protein
MKTFVAGQDANAGQPSPPVHSCYISDFMLCMSTFPSHFLDREDKNESQDNSIWLKEKWSIGEVCNAFLLGHLDYFRSIFIGNRHF